MTPDDAPPASILFERLQDLRRQRERQLTAALMTITYSAVELGVADDACITEVGADGRFRTVAPTSELVTDADRAQYALLEGPCVEASYDFASTLSSSDVALDGRWPRWGPAAAQIGFCSVISLRLYAAETAAMGALNLYSRRSREFSPDDLNVARIAASQASVELARHRGDDDLWRAVDARHRIGQAQGILMERYGMDETKALVVLRRHSLVENTDLAITADTLVRTGTLPEMPG